MSKFIKAIIFPTIVYAVPLSFASKQIIDTRIIILAAAAFIIMISQPDFSVEEVRRTKRSDRYSIAIIFVCGAISQIVPVIDYGYFMESGRIGGFATLLGILMLIGGLGFRIWSIRILGNYFTSAVQIVEGHRVVKHGPYAIVRHPSYLGAWVAIVGSAVFLGSFPGAVLAGVCMTFAYQKRLAAEEATLIEKFGEEYRDYMKATRRIIPGIY